MYRVRATSHRKRSAADMSVTICSLMYDGMDGGGGMDLFG